MGAHTYVEERNGGYYIADTRIPLDGIADAFQDGESPDAILRSFPRPDLEPKNAASAACPPCPPHPTCATRSH